ncbi:hypothetical protein [Kordia jejudonensis]|uniref:hypothetical protein n=1 Tax=Kordia jejudonensis TaxID=1348245 RepID=UPI0006299270|nr:hypothetical protein [Kordia jejudonensis]
MKKDRKLKLIVNKIKISNLNHVFGGNGSREETERCAYTDISCDTRCVDTNTNPIIETEYCWTGATKTNQSLVSCLNNSGGC